MKSGSNYHWRWRADDLLFLFATAVLALAFSPSLSAAQNQEDSHQQAALVAGGSVVVENGRGDVSVEGWDKAEISVDAHKFFDGPDADRERWMRETSVRLEGDDHHRVVKVDYPDDLLHGWNWNHWNGRRGVNLTIHLPRQLDAELTTDRGRTTVQEIAGKLEIGSDRGDVGISRFDGELRLRGDRGNVKVQDSKIHNGIHLTLDRGSAEIELRRLDGEGLLEVSRGDLSVTLPGKASFTLDAERTRRSSFRSDFAVLAQGGFDGSRIHGEVNGGGPTLRLRGERGSVSLHAAAQ
jgi:hypothetical protein